MKKKFLTGIIVALFVICTIPAGAFADNATSSWNPLLDVAFENNDLETAVLILVNDNNVPTSDIFVKARELGYGYTRIIDALIDTKLSCEQVMIEAVQNGAPPSALFDSKKITKEYDYTPDAILRFLVRGLNFMTLENESLGNRNENLKEKEKNLKIILTTCKTLLKEGYSKFDVMQNLCLANAAHETVYDASKQLDISSAVTLKACPKHAEYGHAYISHDLPQKAHIIVGVDHLTIDDDAGRGVGVISPKNP